MADNNTRAECCKRGEASLLSHSLASRPHAGEKQKYRVDGQSVNYAALISSMNVTQKPFDNPKVREALNYALNRPALVKVAFAVLLQAASLLCGTAEYPLRAKFINRGLTNQ
ncbi:hypothetical protein LAD67_15195 [Escherichia coli]|nr:hypothetical protein [Escherichia coli]